MPALRTRPFPGIARARRACAALLALAGLSPEPVRAGVFNQPAGSGLVIVEGLYDTGSRSFDTHGHLIQTAPYDKREGWAYLQYGVTDWLMAIVQPDVVSTSVGGVPGGHYTGVGTSQAGAQIQLPSIGPFAFALQGTVHLPVANRPHNPALVGNTTRDTDGRGLVGAAFVLGGLPAFVDAEAGYRLRSGGSPDEIHVDLTGGLRLRPDVLVLAQSFTTVPTAAGTPYYPRSTFSNLQASAVYDLNAHWAVQIGGFGTVFGRNALRERGLISALWYRF